MQTVLIFSFVFSFAVTANAISCYSCESAYDPASCGEDFDAENYFKVDCSRLAPPRYLEKDLAFRNSTACMKIVYKERGVPKIQRSCFFGDVNETEIGCRMDPTLTAAPMDAEDAACFVCDSGNFCNGGSSLFDAPLFVTLVGFVYLLAKKLLPNAYAKIV